MANEIELKLELAPEAAAFLEASPLLSGTMAKANQRAIYFDTPEKDLASNGLSLRIRRSGRKRTQTVKADGGNHTGLFDRSEWEIPVPSDVPVLDNETPVLSLLGERTSELAPLFTVEIERRTWMMIEGVSSIELVLDRGVARVGERQTPICEVELELKSGDAQALFDLAQKLDAIAPVRLGVATKAERGYQLLGPATRSSKAGPVRLDPALTSAQAFQQIARLCLRHYRLNEAILLETREAEALHQARVAIRRLRSALSLFKTILADDRINRFRTDFRDLAAILGGARDIDVLLERAPPGPLRDRLETARDGAYGAVESALASEQVRHLIIDFVQWLGAGAWLEDSTRRKARDEQAPIFAASALRQFRRKLKKQGEGLRHISDEKRHDIRKMAKKLRYASEFFAALFPGHPQERRHEKFVRSLAKLQEKLGELNDLASTHEVLHHLGLADEPEASHLLAETSKSRLLASAADAYDDLVDARKFWI